MIELRKAWRALAEAKMLGCKSFKTFGWALVIGIMTGNGAIAQPLTPGSWKNQLGSVLTITNVGAGGQLTGTYVTGVGCDAGQPQQLTGWYYDGGSGGGGAIAFSVIWSGCSSITSWSGQYDSTTQNFQAMWHLPIAAPPKWNGIYLGTDTFTRQ
jgi:avidin family protein